MHKDLKMNDTVDGINCGFKFQNATCAGSVKQYKVWPNDLDQR